MKNLLRQVLGLTPLGRVVVIEATDFDSDTQELVASIRLRRNVGTCCEGCGRRASGL